MHDYTKDKSMKEAFQKLVFLLLCNLTFSQSHFAINKDIDITDSLTYEKELRIYKSEATTNYRTVLRLYQLRENEWRVDFYQYYAATQGKATNFNKSTINLTSDGELLWLKILNTNIDYLANWDAIEYKLKEKGKIMYDRGRYDMLWRTSTVIDGENYNVIVRNGKRLNDITYSNPRNYLDKYPKVDELSDFVELLTLMKTELKIEI
jgi:hypothetical protein